MIPYCVGEEERVSCRSRADLHNLVPLPTEKDPPEAAPGPAADGQPTPPWITMARQKRRGAPDQLPSQEDKPGTRTLKSETGKQAKVPERAQVLRAEPFCSCGSGGSRGGKLTRPGLGLV